jgi:hypothetical protein
MAKMQKKTWHGTKTHNIVIHVRAVFYILSSTRTPISGKQNLQLSLRIIRLGIVTPGVTVFLIVVFSNPVYYEIVSYFDDLLSDSSNQSMTTTTTTNSTSPFNLTNNVTSSLNVKSLTIFDDLHPARITKIVSDTQIQSVAVCNMKYCCWWFQ